MVILYDDSITGDELVDFGSEDLLSFSFLFQQSVHSVSIEYNFYRKNKLFSSS